MQDRFTIYQLKDTAGARAFRFEPYPRLQEAGLELDPENYNTVYTAPLAPDMSLDDIYTMLNINHPEDFTGHSLSASDVVVLHRNGESNAYYVDNFGYKNVPEFLERQFIADTKRA